MPPRSGGGDIGDSVAGIRARCPAIGASRQQHRFLGGGLRRLACQYESHGFEPRRRGLYRPVRLPAYHADATTTAIFNDVRLVRSVKDGFTPYRDYIGSVLEILEPHTGKLQVIHRSPEPFEAPNWTRDGASLIYNVSGSGTNRGRLRRYDLATGAITPLNTGSANRCNNDHVLTFDGTTLAISDQSAGGGSSVYIVPAAGGDPRRLTTLTPSYAHGWSPDAQFIVYTGGRSNKFDIYKMAAAGGGEIRLTDSPGLNDGPEYTPDGKYIYFNSTRTGRMQLWRMNPDGSGQQQVTDDQFVTNWVPPHFAGRQMDRVHQFSGRCQTDVGPIPTTSIAICA